MAVYLGSTRTYSLPNSELKIDVSYDIDAEEKIAVFSSASTEDGETIDCDSLYVKIIDREKTTTLVNEYKFISLADYFSDLLNEDDDVIDDINSIGHPDADSKHDDY